MELIVSLRKALPDFDLEVSLRARGGDINVIIGPSGAGKTTLIRLMAGLETPEEGYISYNGQIWVDTEENIFLPPQKRQVGYVFQDYTLFPHLNVYRNVAFAARQRDEIEKLLRAFGIWHLKDCMPHEISGGERQRCAICQNLARKPQVLLLDEPFSALDMKIRRILREELKALKKELSIPIIHVTHDLMEALFLGDNIVPLVQGKIARGWLQSGLKDLLEDHALIRRGLMQSGSALDFGHFGPDSHKV